MGRDKKQCGFYNATTMASYDFELQQVVLDSIDSKILKALDKGALPARNKVYPLTAHEYTHWRDHVSTLWGRRVLTTFYGGIEAWRTQDASTFHKIVTAKRAVGRASSRRYYRFAGPKSGATPPWHWTLSIGMAFDGYGKLIPSDPIPFVRFYTPPRNSDEHLIVRMPISAASLAEVRAMYAEFSWVVAEKARYPQGPTKPDQWLLDYNSTIYSEDYLEYTTALHLLSNQTGARSILEIFPHASALAGIALNFPVSLIPKLQVPEEWMNVWGKGTHNLIDPLLQDRSPGFLFILLCHYAVLPTGTDLTEWLDCILTAAGGFSLSDLHREWANEIIKPVPTTVPPLKALLTVGCSWALASNVISSPDLLLRSLESRDFLALPGALTEDMEIWFPTINYEPFFGDASQTHRRCEWLQDMVSGMDSFCDVCGW